MNWKKIKWNPEQLAAIQKAQTRRTVISNIRNLTGKNISPVFRGMLGTIGSPSPWRITIPDWHPTLLNRLTGTNIGHATGMKEADAKKLYDACWGIMPDATGRRHLTMTMVYPRKPYPDRDNVWKSILDGLVKIGALVDDSPQWLSKDEVIFQPGPKATILDLKDIP